MDCPLLSSIYHPFLPLLLYVLYGPDFFVAIRIAIVDLTIKWGLWFQQFNNTTFLCLSKERTWIANTICHGLCFSSMIWGERWSVLLILVELVNITVSTFFSSITKIYNLLPRSILVTIDHHHSESQPCGMLLQSTKGEIIILLHLEGEIIHLLHFQGR